MRCRYCGQRIPEGELYCRHCGKEVRIVPDYNPLDDMLTAQIKGAIDGDEIYTMTHIRHVQPEIEIIEMREELQEQQEMLPAAIGTPAIVAAGR